MASTTRAVRGRMVVLVVAGDWIISLTRIRWREQCKTMG